MQASSFFLGPHHTPKSVKILIWITVITSLLSPILTFILNHYFHLSGPSQWLALTKWGLNLRYLWEPITYFLIHSSGVGISLSLFLSLAFNMVLLWFTGSEIATRFGARSFILFYLGAALFAGLIAAGAIVLFSSESVLLGSGTPILALLMAWAMIYPDLELYFFFLLRIKAKWVVAILLGFALLSSLSYGSFIPLLADLSAILWGFLIGRLIWKLPNPYPLNLHLRKRTKKRERSSGKIIDISVMQESDDAFMDRMLDKIAKRGESALNATERERMNKISKRKR